MSEIDTRLDPVLRQQLLDEVRGFLPAFLSSAAAERKGPVLAAKELLGLDEQDLRIVVALHLMLAPEVRALLADLPRQIRRPASTSQRPREETQRLTGSIDWAATVRIRAARGATAPTWVVRPTRRAFDMPENQALLWTLRSLGSLSALVAGSQQTGPWAAEIVESQRVLQRALRAPWLAEVTPTWPGDRVYRSLRASRLPLYGKHLAPVASLLRETLYDPSSGQVSDIICRHYFEPSRDWQLFETGVLFRLLRSIAVTGMAQSRQRLLHGVRGPVATFRADDGHQVDVWYQTWPPGLQPSHLSDAMSHYAVQGGGTRPDIVVQQSKPEAAPTFVLMELKASSSGSYIGQGIAQLLGYVRDRSALDGHEGVAWLVAPATNAFTSKPPDGRVVWLVGHDAVGSAVARAVRGLSGWDDGDTAP